MAWQSTPFAPFFLVSAGVSLTLAGVFFTRRDRPGAFELSALFAGLTGWALLSYGELTSVGLGQKLAFARLSYGFVGVTAVAWFAFAAAFTDRWALGRRFWAALGLGPVLVVAVAWTSPESGLLWTAATTETVGGVSYLRTEKGPAFVAWVLFAYSLVFVGSVLLGLLSLTSQRVYRGQSLLLLVAVAATWATNAAHVLGLFPMHVDPTPLAFTVSGTLFAVAVLRLNLLDVLPAAREAVRNRVLDDLRDGILVVTDGQVSDLNPAAAEMLDEPLAEVGGRRLDAVAPELAERLDAGERAFEYRRDGAEGIYDVRVSSFSSVTGRIEGTVLTLRDVTERRRREQRLSVLNRVLRHDLRNDLNVVSGYASMFADADAGDADRRMAADRVVDRVDEMLALSNKVRAVERALDSRSRPRETIDVGPRLRETVAHARREAPEATVTYDGPESVPVEATPLVGAVFDNLVENALAHGGGDSTVAVRASVGDEVVVTVADDGPGIPDHELAAVRGDGETPLHHASGFGLWLVRWLVNQSGGRVTFTSDESGTVARVTLRRAAEAAEAEADVESGTLGEPRFDLR